MSFDLQPSLRGRLIALRPLQEDDFERLFEAASDPLIWAQHPEPNRYQRDVFRRFFDGAIASKGAFAVIDLASNSIVGSSRYYDYNPAQREIMIGFTFLTRFCWGGAYNGELKSLMLDHAFRFVDRVLFQVGEKNIRSQNALRKIGAQFLNNVELPGLDGTMHPCAVYVIERTRSEGAGNKFFVN